MDVPLAAPSLSEETLDEAERVLREEFFLGGETVEAFESDLKTYFGVDHAVTVDSGTRALQLALEGLGIGEGDTVVTTPATFVATANVIVRTGATPRFVDIDMDTYGPDFEELERVVSSEAVDAVMPIHLYGYPIDVDRIQEITGDVPVVSDACQAHGARRDGYKIGTRSDAAGLSFYPSKNMTVAGDGGVMLTDDDEIARIARSLRDVGRSESGYEHERIGYTARLNTVNAAIGRQQLHQLDAWNERRRTVAGKYHDAFSDLPIDLPPVGTTEIHPAWYFYTVRVEDPDSLRDHLADHGVEGGSQYRIPVHLQPPYREMGHEEGEFPAAETWADTLVTLPCHQHMTDEDVKQVTDAVRGYFA
ncbi:MAG: DegT/DnrJ/EryC1/StrS family aminotransferase [Halobaculum sp.]